MLYEGINALCVLCGRIGQKIEACPFTVREQPKEQSMERNEGHTETQSTQGEDRLKEKEKPQEDYGEWMVVSRKKVNSKAKSVQRSLVMNQMAKEQLMQTSLATTAKPSVAGQNSKSGKRKALHTQTVVSQRETNVMAMSILNKPKLGKGAKDKGVRAKMNQKATNLVGLQSNGVGPSNKGGLFVFGSETKQGPFCLSSSFNPKVHPKEKPISTEKESFISEHSSRNNGSQREVGDLLQRKSYSGGRRDNTLDKARSNRSVGLVRDRSDGGVEEPVPVNGEKQTAGLSADERRSMDHDFEPMVEVLEGPTSNFGASGDKLKAISHRIRHAKLGKIYIRGGSGVDRAKDHSKEDIANQPGGMLVDGQSARGENDSICRARDEWHDPNQGNSGRVRDNQAFGDFIPGDIGVEEGVVRGIEVERH